MENFYVEKEQLIAYFLYRMRVINKISLRTMYQHLSLKQSTYGKIETGALKITLSNLFLILEILGLSLINLNDLLDLAEHLISESEGLDLLKYAQHEDISEILSEQTILWLKVLSGGAEKLDNIRDIDEYLGITRVAILDEELYKLTKDSEAFKKSSD